MELSTIQVVFHRREKHKMSNF